MHEFWSSWRITRESVSGWVRLGVELGWVRGKVANCNCFDCFNYFNSPSYIHVLE